MIKQVISAITDILSINSVEDTALENKPFGEGIYQTLKHFLSLAESMGFKTINYDNYIGEVVFGSGEDFAVLCHLDTVPAGSGWSYPAFQGTIVGDKIYGRGATDNKGPAIICLYALKKLKDSGFKPSKTIKLIVGCDEESGWKCIEHYKKVAKMAKTGFSPDGSFPVIYAEKGILHLDINFDKSKILEMTGGSATNMVCDYAVASGRIDKAAAEKNGLYLEEDNIASKGKSAHGSTPHEGDNAIEKLIKYFTEIGEIDEKIYRTLFEKTFELRALSDETGDLTMSANKVRTFGSDLIFSVDIRYPATLKQQDVLDILDKNRLQYNIISHQKALYHDKSSPLISTLSSVYKKFTGGAAEPIAIGGGTYARALELGVAFGPEFPSETSAIHQPDEFISISNVNLLFEIYLNAIKELCK